MLRKADEFIEENLDAMLHDLSELVEIESVEGAPAPGAPYGTGVRRALDKSLEIARRLGLETCDGDGHVGYAAVPGRGKAGYLAAISHVDVVPAGDGWHFEPFRLTQKDGWLIGRGTDDDKNAVIITLYAAAFLKRQGGTEHELRILLGCNEETGMHDVPYYLARYPQPLFCLTPDVFFPACNGEKGIYTATLRSPALGGNLLDFQAGEAANAVPGSAYAVVKTQKPLRDTGHIRVTAEKGEARLVAVGKGGHASAPAGTVNAIGLLVGYLLENQLAAESERPFLELLDKLFDGYNGSALGIQTRDEIFHDLTCVGGTIRMENGCLAQTIDIRYPAVITWEKIHAIMGTHAENAGAALLVDKASDPFYVDENDPALRACLTAYNDLTGRDDKPEVIGGTTYARMFRRAIGFGMDDMGEAAPDFVGALHGPDEGFSIQQFKIALKAYISAFLALDKLDY